MRRFSVAIRLLDFSFGIELHVGNYQSAFHQVFPVLGMLQMFPDRDNLSHVHRDGFSLLVLQNPIVKSGVPPCKLFQRLAVFHFLPENLRSLFPQIDHFGLAVFQAVRQNLHSPAMDVSAHPLNHPRGAQDIGLVRSKGQLSRVRVVPQTVLALSHIFHRVQRKLRCRKVCFCRHKLVGVLGQRHHGAHQIVQGGQLLHGHPALAQVSFLRLLRQSRLLLLHSGQLLAALAGPTPGLISCCLSPLAAQQLRVNGCSQTTQHFLDAAGFKVRRHAVHAVVLSRRVYNIVLQGFQIREGLLIVDRPVRQVGDLDGLLKILRRNMAFLGRVQQHPVQLGPVIRHAAQNRILSPRIPRPLQGIPASGKGGALVCVHLCPFFRPLPVSFRRLIHNPLGVRPGGGSGLPFDPSQTVGYPLLDSRPVPVQILVNPLGQHPGHGLVGHALPDHPAENLHSKVRPRFLPVFAVGVLDGGADHLPHLGNPVHLFQGPGDFLREEPSIVVCKYLIHPVDGAVLVGLSGRQGNSVPRQLFLGVLVIAVLVDKLPVLRPAPLDVEGEVVQVRVLVPQPGVPLSALSHQAFGDILRHLQGRPPVRLSA